MDNPRTYPMRPRPLVEAEVEVARVQRDELRAEMERTGQAAALDIAELRIAGTGPTGACATTTWVEGRITVLPLADVVELFSLPRTVDGDATSMTVRWDVAARVCAGCWQAVPGLDPPRVITRRWPSPAELEILEGLCLPYPPP